MFTFEEDTRELHPWIRDELELTSSVEAGASGMTARRIQEWLNLRGFAVTVDGAYGPITADAVADFQHSLQLAPTGRVDAATFTLLTAPLRAALRQPALLASDLASAVVELARAHLANHPREIGGQNRGPWVRLYMHGNQGSDWPWCAGFASFVLDQACGLLGVAKPIAGSFSCDSLAAQAKAARRFKSERELMTSGAPSGSLFLVRRTDTDWTHVGIVEISDTLQLKTIEGNTNDAGDREGYEVCRRTRAYDSKDFVILSN